MKNLILVLGAPNDENGNLSSIALDRLNGAYELYRFNRNAHVLCTGGFGKSFNTTDKPHAYYAQSYLIDKGVSDDDLPEYVLSSHTVDDMRMSRDFIFKSAPSLLMVVTSDFHMKRVMILYEILINYPSVVFVPARSTISENELAALILHEEKAIHELKCNNYRIY